MQTNTAMITTKPIIVVTTNNTVKRNLDGSIKRTHTNKVAGVSSEVYAFNTEKDIAAMITVLDKHIAEAKDNNKRQIAARNKMLFLIGINIGIRASDLRKLRYSFFYEEEKGKLIFRDSYTIMPKKTAHKHKYVKLFFNDVVRKAISEYTTAYPFESLNDYLFTSRKGNEAISEASIWRLMNDTALEAGIKQNIGSHSLRKTFGYWVWHNAEDKNKALIILQQIFNHSSPATTAKYIGITETEMEEAYDSIALGYEFAATF